MESSTKRGLRKCSTNNSPTSFLARFKNSKGKLIPSNILSWKAKRVSYKKEKNRK